MAFLSFIKLKIWTPDIWRMILSFAVIETLIFMVLNLMKLAQLHNFINVFGRPFSPFIILAVGCLGLLIFWIYFLSFRGKIVALTCIHMFLSLLMFGDLVYYRYFADLLSVPVLLQITQTNEISESIFSLMQSSDYLFFLDWILIIPYAIYVFWTRRLDKPSHVTSWYSWERLGKKSVISFCVFITSATLFFVPFNEIRQHKAKDLFITNWWNLGLYSTVGLLPFHAFDVYRYAKTNWFTDQTLSTEEKKQLQDWLARSATTRKSQENDSIFGAYAGANVIVVQVEAMQNFVIGKTYLDQEITPNLNEFMNTSVYFSEFYHQSSAGRTADADFVANCSLHPVSVGAVFIRYSQNDYRCLPNVLKQTGYSTNVFHAYEGGFWNRNMMYEAFDYDTFYTKKEFSPGEYVGWSLGDKGFFEQSVKFMSQKDQPFYSFLITLSSHHPYNMPSHLRPLQLGVLEDTILGNYLHSMHYVDAAIGELIQHLKDEGLWDQSIFVLYGDHDNSIRDMNMYENFLGHEPSVMEQLQIEKQIPLFIHLPDEQRSGVITQPAGQLDITPTILSLLGISNSDIPYLGTSLLSEISGPSSPVIFRDGSYVDGIHYYKASKDNVMENGTCTDLASGLITDVRACKPVAEQAFNQLQFSDQIIEYDLMNQLQKK